jgi:hypothetical protein
MWRCIVLGLTVQLVLQRSHYLFVYPQHHALHALSPPFPKYGAFLHFWWGCIGSCASFC